MLIPIFPSFVFNNLIIFYFVLQHSSVNSTEPRFPRSVSTRVILKLNFLW